MRGPVLGESLDPSKSSNTFLSSAADYPFINYYVIHQPRRESHEVYRRIRNRIFEAAVSSPEAAQLNAATAAAAAAAAAMAAVTAVKEPSKVR